MKKKKKRKSQSTKSDFEPDSYDPYYVLEARILNPIINKRDFLNKISFFGFDKEDVLELEIFIFGHGKINKEKSFFNTIFPLGLKEKNQRIDKSMWEEEIGASYYAVIENGHIEKHALPIRRFDADAGLFFPVPPGGYARADFYGKELEAVLRASAMLFTENEYCPAISIKVNIPKDMPDGDHQFKVLYFYNDFKKWYFDESVITFHVNSFWEKHKIIYVFVGAIVGASTIAIGRLVWEYVIPFLKGLI